MQALANCDDLSAYIETSIVQSAMFKDLNSYLYCSMDCEGDMIASSDPTSNGYRDFSANVSTIEGGNYAYTMVGALFGESWGGYLGAASYLNIGNKTISTTENRVFVASPDEDDRVTRGGSPYGAPIPPGDEGISVCITESRVADDTSCVGRRDAVWTARVAFVFATEKVVAIVLLRPQQHDSVSSES